MKEELFQEMCKFWEEFVTEHNATTKVSDARARKSINEIKKLVTPYKKASVSEGK
jgi:hypothetical protein